MSDDAVSADVPVSDAATTDVAPEVSEMAAVEVPAASPPQESAAAPDPVQPAQASQAPATPISVPSIKDHLSEAFAALTGRKRARLDKILALAAKKHSIKNDDVEKLLHVSDASATNYLNALVKEGKLKRVRSAAHAAYELA